MWFNTFGIKSIGGTHQLFSWCQLNAKASTPSVYWTQNLELNFSNFLFLLSANLSIVTGPHFFFYLRYQKSFPKLAIIKIKNLSEIICLNILHSRNPFQFNNNTVSHTYLINIYSKILQLYFHANHLAYLYHILIIGMYFNQFNI